MFATGPVAFHTILSLIAIGTGACVILAMSKGRSPGWCTLAFLVTMILTDVTGFFLPAPKFPLPSHITGIISLVVIAIALAANYAFHFAGAWRAIYAVTMGIAIYLNFFVLVTQLFLKIGFLHALAPNAPDNPEPPFLIAQAIVLAIFVWLIWKCVKNFRADAT
jgi:hypothetical protein